MTPPDSGAGRKKVRGRSRLVSVPSIAAVSMAVLITAITLGLRLSDFGLLAPFPRAGNLDYSAAPLGGFAPLDPRLVSRLLGLSPARVQAGGVGVSTHRDQTITTPAAPVLVKHFFTNDNFAQAYAIPSVPFTAETETSRATVEQDEPRSCATLGGRTAWYMFRPDRDIGLLADTLGTEYATALTVYRGDNLAALRPIQTCSSNPRGNSAIAFPAKANTMYFFQIDGAIGGRLVFSLQRQGITTLASQATDGAWGDGDSYFPVISPDGRRAIFMSSSTNFGPRRDLCLPVTRVMDPCLDFPLYMRDRPVHRTTLVYAPEHPAQMVGQLWEGVPSGVSKDGRYISFWGQSGFQVPAPNSMAPSPWRWDAFRIDTTSGQIERVSVPCHRCQGTQTDYPSIDAEMSADGRYIAFASQATNLVEGPSTGRPEVYVRDMKSRTNVRASVPNGCDRRADRCLADDAASKPLGERGSSVLGISGNARYVVFRSAASNLVKNDTNGVADVFVRDLVARTTERINVSSSEAQANAETRDPISVGVRMISDDGRYVVFNSDATNLVPGTKPIENIYRRDRLLGTTELVTASSTGEPANKSIDRYQDFQSIIFEVYDRLVVHDTHETPMAYATSVDARFVVFSSGADNLVPGDENGLTDVFMRDMETGLTTRVSVSSLGEESETGACNAPTISEDARFVAYHCVDSGLGRGDSNALYDAFVRELPGLGMPTGWY